MPALRVVPRVGTVRRCVGTGAVSGGCPVNPDPIAEVWAWATPVAQLLGLLAIGLLTLSIIRDVGRW